jgi:hypothetical protein
MNKTGKNQRALRVGVKGREGLPAEQKLLCEVRDTRLFQDPQGRYFIDLPLRGGGPQNRHGEYRVLRQRRQANPHEAVILLALAAIPEEDETLQEALRSICAGSKVQIFRSAGEGMGVWRGFTRLLNDLPQPRFCLQT